MIRGSGTPAGGQEDSAINGFMAADSGRVSPKLGALPIPNILGQSIGKDSNVSMINKDYIDVEKKILRVLAQRYELREELGKGAHGRIYSGRDRVTKLPFAVKVMEKVQKNKSKFVREISLMKDMQKYGQPGFPKLLYHSSDKAQYYIVMDLLTSSLKDLKDQMEDKRFSVKTVTMIALQILQRLESIHKYGYVHRDLKPANMMVSKNSKGELSIIYLIDFGLTKKQNQVSNLPQHDKSNKVVGTAVYAGINAHLPSANYYKKDDLESMMYVLCYLGTGSLPWKNFKATEIGLEKMMKYKIKISPFDLFQDMPVEFAQALDYIKNQPSDSSIDYQYIESLFKQVAQNMKFKVDNRFDWLPLNQSQTINFAGVTQQLTPKSPQVGAAQNNNFLTVKKATMNIGDYQPNSQNTGLGAGLASHIQSMLKQNQSANLNTAFADSTMMQQKAEGGPNNEGQSSYNYGVQTNVQNNPLNSIKIDFQSKVEGSADHLSKKLTFKNTLLAKQTIQQIQGSALNMADADNPHALKYQPKATNRDHIDGISNPNDTPTSKVRDQAAKSTSKPRPTSLQDPTKTEEKPKISTGKISMTQDLVTKPKEKGDENIERMDDQQKQNQTHEIVFQAVAREEARSISPDIGNNMVQGKKKKGVKKGKKGLNKKVTDSMAAQPYAQLEGTAVEDSKKVPRSTKEIPLQEPKPIITMQQHQTVQQQFPKYDGKYDINLTVNIMQNNNNSGRAGQLSDIHEISKSNAAENSSGNEEKKSEPLGQAGQQQNLIKCPPDQQVSFAPNQNQANQNPNIVQILLVNVSSAGSANHNQNDLSGRIQNFSVQINSANQAVDVGRLQENSNQALLQKVLEDHQKLSLIQLRLDQIEEEKADGEPNSPTFEEFQQGILSERGLKPSTLLNGVVLPQRQDDTEGDKTGLVYAQELNVEEPNMFSPRQFFTHSNSDRMRCKSCSVIP